MPMKNMTKFWMVAMGEQHEGIGEMAFYHSFDDAKAKAEEWIARSTFTDWEWEDKYAATGGCDFIVISENVIW
jgi:hypothetical protein